MRKNTDDISSVFSFCIDAIDFFINIDYNNLRDLKNIGV